MTVSLNKKMIQKEQFLQEITDQIVNTPIIGIKPETKQYLDSLTDYLLRPSVNPKALGLTYATIKYWETKGYLILGIPKEADEWRKYSIIEYLWFQLLKRVVDMGCAIDKIAPKLLFAYTNFTGEFSSRKFTDPQTPITLVEGIRINPLTNFLSHILLIITARSKASLNISDEGFQFYFQKASKDIIANDAYNIAFNTGVNISISDILFAYILGVDSNTQEKIQLFNRQEVEVIKLLSNESVSQIIIKQNNGKIYELNAVEKIHVNDINKHLREFITEDYQEINFKTNKNKTLSLQRTTKQNFD